MHDVIALWHADHINFAKLLNLLEDQIELFHEGGLAQYDMLDIMHYMTHYPDVLHHPMENLVLAMIKERERSTAPKVDELMNQHAQLKKLGDELVRGLDDIVNGAFSSRVLVEASARAYVTNFRNRMRVEDTEILPLAARLLSDEDWSAIGAAIPHIEDPLFGSSAEARYAALRQQIARPAR